MQCFPPNWLTHLTANTHYLSRQLRTLSPRLFAWLLLLSSVSIVFSLTATAAQAQREQVIKQEEDKVIQEFTLPQPPRQAPVYRPRAVPRRSAVQPTYTKSQRKVARPQRGVIRPQRTTTRQSLPPSTPQRPRLQTAMVSDATPPNQYIMEFNRSPVVGNRFRLRGIYAEARLGFTRPRSWQMQSVKALIRFQHSPALLASRSNLTVRVNGTSIGSVPLNRRQSQVGNVLLNIPSHLIQDFNEISFVAQQNNSNTCTDPNDQTLWTEILPDSQLVFNFRPRSVPLNFSRYPFPFFDNLSLEPNQIAYLLPRDLDRAWLTATARFQASLGRLADFRPLDTRLLRGIKQVAANERLVIIGTPDEQPALRQLQLPFGLAGNQILDGNQYPLPDDVGVLMMTTTANGSVPVLIATGNGQEGVAKAVQALVQAKAQKMAVGQGILVSQIADPPTPGLRQWPRYLPDQNSFKLSDLHADGDKPFADMTVRGSSAPPIEFDFRALPNDRFTRGSSMNLVYSYGPQVNPRTSAVEVLLDGVFIGGARLTSEEGETRKTLKVNLPENLVKPTSKIQVAFRLHPKELPEKCGGLVADQQLSGTVHADTNFDLNREVSVQLPDLRLLQVGFPFVAPQDLSSTAVVLPDSPSNIDLLTLLELSERLGRLSQADSVKLNVYTSETFPTSERGRLNLVGIGVRDKFPFPEVFESSGFALKDLFLRSWSGNVVQALPDEEGAIEETISPWNRDRVLLALSAQTENGLDRVRQIISKDPWFFQLQKDTVLISSNQKDPTAYDPDAYDLKFLQTAQPRRIENTSPLSKASRFLQAYWFLLPTGIVGVAILLYGIVQLYIKRITAEDKK